MSEFVLDRYLDKFVLPVTQIVLHSTGGIRGHEGVVQTLVARKCAVHYVCETDGTFVQVASLDMRGKHITGLSDQSIGIEFVNPLFDGPVAAKERANGVARLPYKDTVRGKPRAMLSHTKEQLDSCMHFVPQLCKTLGIDTAVPTEPDGTLMRRSFKTLPEARAFRGVLCHYHWHLNKLDAGTDLIVALWKMWRKS